MEVTNEMIVKELNETFYDTDFTHVKSIRKHGPSIHYYDTEILNKKIRLESHGLQRFPDCKLHNKVDWTYI